MYFQNYSALFYIQKIGLRLCNKYNVKGHVCIAISISFSKAHRPKSGYPTQPENFGFHPHNLPTNEDMVPLRHFAHIKPLSGSWWLKVGLSRLRIRRDVSKSRDVAGCVVLPSLLDFRLSSYIIKYAGTSENFVAFEMAELSQLWLTWLGTVQTQLHSFPNISVFDGRVHHCDSVRGLQNVVAF